MTEEERARVSHCIELTQNGKGAMGDRIEAMKERRGRRPGPNRARERRVPSLSPQSPPLPSRRKPRRERNPWPMRFVQTSFSRLPVRL
ncbi:hypothetical protein MYCTH_2307606 [Thermothelomyces thermophilus ATCC 42464]|uniref:Uncharacterized protein n=1 Tax=Thermothelomyces thermophilus (strain ATCC 42464 / BCRC 31852 / DSM 1799) TaxID=573729 RepID=G2QGB1_THET4|nr:uncharacterized protein MYCTH_2307606 [Thermothelomyces thermophilus ATCC 42464]AEO59371.1 hypothetical protein MYCTH_2307606 [Thermothelomyces thermophilus ATCC 42464]